MGSTQNTDGPQGPLENHLRNLILSNSDTTMREPTSQHKPPSTELSGYQPAPPLNHIAEQDNQGAVPHSNRDAQAAPKASRKRPNQAQRRQMSAQLSIPIDPRPQPSPQAVRHFPSPMGYGNNQSQGSHQRVQRPQSAGFRPTYYNQPFQQTENSSRGYPAQPRHQQSQSYHGPGSQARAPDWRQAAGRGAEYASRGHNPSFSDHGAPSPGSHRYQNSIPHHQPRHHHVRSEDLREQTLLLEDLCNTIIADAEIDVALIQEKETFRINIERICQNAIAQFEQESNGLRDFPLNSVQLRCFGSLSSGFATKASDMDLGLLSPLSHPQPDELGSLIPRIIEKAFLDAGLGARLLTRTRVPIIKLCETPPEQLRQDLLKERSKWEQGITEDHEPAGADDDDHEDHERPPTQEDSTTHAVATHKGSDDSVTSASNDDRVATGKVSNIASHRVSKSSTHHQTEADEKRFHLKQADRQHLVNYYSLAKRLLRKLDGRDITHSTAKHFSLEDLTVLNDVSHAFVHGLSDRRLRERLMSYQSFSRSDINGSPFYRSLAGVYTQAEGEKMAMVWEDRKVHERNAENEFQAQRKINNWRELQDRNNFGLDILGHNKELQLAADHLRRIPSIQLMMLEQGQYESPTQYHGRTTRLLLDLGGYDSTTSTLDNLPIHTTTVEQYINGIWNEEIRKQVKAFALESGYMTLRAVARRHKSLHLATEFEKAVEKGLYSDGDVEDIKAYIALLRMPLGQIRGNNQHLDFIVDSSNLSAPLLEKIRRVTDPAKLAPNQPRDPYRDRLEFPKSGVGVQCDINFSAHLALHNTLLLRCYSHTDPRVRPLVLFVKHWAKVRNINTPYRGTLSSYGYVLMVLHYLVNIAQPFVCPNLQALAPPPDPSLTIQQVQETMVCKGKNVQFWRDENAIKKLAREGTLTQNRDSIGFLLRGFFEYYAQSHFMSTVPGRGFDWGRDVLSLRTQGGLLSKQDKGWTGAKTVLEKVPSVTPADQTAPPKTPVNAESPAPVTPVTQGPVSDHENKPAVTPKDSEVKEVRHRYLFAIEDPFELDHNVARTVTHNGIVSIRDEFRRAWRIIRSTGKAGMPQENLLQDVKEEGEEKNLYWELLAELHGLEP